MSDLGAQLRASLDAQSLIQDMLTDANTVLRHGNDLFHTPSDRDAYLLTLAAALRVTNALGELNRLVRHPDEA